MRIVLKIGKRSGVFLMDQLHQVREGGVSCIKRKLSNLWELSYMSLLAPPAVSLHINWPRAYYFVGNKLREKHKRILLFETAVEASEIQDAQDKAIDCFKKFIRYQPSLKNFWDWVDINCYLYYAFVINGQMEESKNIVKRVGEVRSQLMRDHQLDCLGFEFIEQTFAYGSIGVYERLECYIKAGKLGLLPSKKLILLLDPGISVNNPAYLNYWRKHITIISDPPLIKALAPLKQCLTAPFRFFLPFDDRAMVTHEALGMVREEWNKKHAPILTCSTEDQKRGRECLKTLGVPESAWFVCLHVRESGWNDSGSTENFRNADINSYTQAIEAVVDAGGWVIRIGDSSMSPAPDLPQVVDYARSDAKSDWMDIFLCAQCRFFIGTSSGMWSVALAFGVPLVMTNFLPGQALYYFSGKDIIIPRLCRSKNENRILSFRELVYPPVGMLATQALFERYGIEVIENTAEEIRDVVVEMLERLDGTLNYSDEDEEYQKRFKAMTENFNEPYGDGFVTVNARMGRAFLQKHSGLLPEKGEPGPINAETGELKPVS